MSRQDFYQYCKTHSCSLKHVNSRHFYLVDWLSKNPRAIGFEGEMFREVYLPDGTSMDLAGFSNEGILIGEVKTGAKTPGVRDKITTFAERLAIREDINPADISMFYLWTRGGAESAGLFSSKLRGGRWRQREIPLSKEYENIWRYSSQDNIHLRARAG